MTMKTTIAMLLGTCLLLFGCDADTKNVDSCGDGFVDPGEQCDGMNLNLESCASLGHYNAVGTLRCQENCTFDRADCGGICGDGAVDDPQGEQCDGGNLHDQTCASLGFAAGALACDPDCQFDVTACQSLCGNSLKDPTEECDDGNAQSSDGCSNTCRLETGFTCTDDNPSICTPICGDGHVVGEEPCDGTELGGQTCSDFGFLAGELVCNDDCTIDSSGCFGACGDGTVTTPVEDCEDGDLNGGTCQTEGFYQGTLRCGTNCRYDTTGCTGHCGDGIIQGSFGEVCDGITLNGQTCVSQGYAKGTLGCLSTCQWDYSNCSMCGNNVIDSGEVCDGLDVNSQSCVDMGFLWGPLLCEETCLAYDLVQCRTTDTIGMIAVPAGTFQRDSSANNLSTVSTFTISEREITRAQWVAVTGWADPSNVTYSSGTSDPVQNVNWYDAIAFCNKLSLLEGLTPVYAVTGVDFNTLTYAQIPTTNNATWNAAAANWAANGYRLPTEMEWMWAAMGADTENPGAVNTTGYLKAFAGSTGSNAVGDYAWYDVNSASKTHPAGSKQTNELGLFDISGNVFEWVWDWHAPYPIGARTDHTGPPSSTLRVGRGGDWSHGASICTISYRIGYSPEYRVSGIGFRIVRR